MPEFAARRQTPVKPSYFQGVRRDAVAACAYGVAGRSAAQSLARIGLGVDMPSFLKTSRASAPILVV
jgi:hypothetical protein